MPRSLTVTEIEDGNFVVTSGEAFQHGMCFDECMGVVARWLLAPYGDSRPGLPLIKMESYWEMKTRIEEEFKSTLRPSDRLLLEERLAQ